MKNFFKKLSFVLALAMIVTAIAPAGKASAATAPSYKYNKKVLYIGGDMTGKYGDTHKFPINNAKGYTVTWKSSKKSVATVDAKSGNIKAVGVGTSVITATATSKAGKATELKATVFVKQNGEKVGFGTLAKVKEMAVGDSVKVNVYRELAGKKYWTQADKTVVTDYTKWESSNPEVATVSKWGTVKALAAGEATITAKMMQTEGSTVVDSASFKVTVKAGLTEVKQTSINTFEAKFASDLSAVANKDNVKVYSMVGNTKVTVVVKEVKFDATDKTKAVVTTYADFVKDTEYVVEYAETNAKFKGADLSKEAVAYLKISTTEAVKNEATEIKVQAFNANDVEIAVAGLPIDISAEISPDYYLDTASKKITFFNSGKTATVKAVFHTYTYGDDYKEITKDVEAVIKSVEKAAITVKSVDTFTVYKGDVDFAKPSNTIAVSDDGTYKVAVKLTTSDDKEVKSTDATDKFTFSSSDNTTLLVIGTTLYPVKEGGATVIVKYGDTVVGAYAVVIGAKRVASDISVKLDKTNLSSNADDSVKLVVTAKDQYGVDRTGEDGIVIKPASIPSGAPTGIPSASGDKNNEFVFKGDVYDTVGTYRYEVKVGDQAPRFVAFEVKNPGTEVASTRISEAGKTVDLALKVGDTNKTDTKDFSMELSTYNKDGYKIANIDLKATKTAATPSTTGSLYYATVDAPSGKSASDIADFVSVSGKVNVAPIKLDTGVFTKAPTGTYVVKVFEVVMDSKGDVKENAIAVTNFTLTDTQATPVINVVKTQSDASTAKLALQNKDDVITIKFGDNFYNSNVTDVKVIGVEAAGNTIAITEITLDVDVKYGEDTGTISQKIAFSATFTLKK